MVMSRGQGQRLGFTIVELLIAVVVIAILATITIVAYNGITVRAANSAIVAAARQSVSAVQAYVTKVGTYPAVTGQTLEGAPNVHYACITTENGCERRGGVTNAEPIVANPEFDESMEAAGIGVPRKILRSSVGAVGKGIYYTYQANRTYAGKPAPVLITYYLQGQFQQCGLPNVTSIGIRLSNDPSTTGYSMNLPDENQTYCTVSVDV